MGGLSLQDNTSRCGCSTSSITDNVVPRSFTMTWDEVCSKFTTLNLNWNHKLVPVSAERHWSWPKPSSSDDSGEWLSLRMSFPDVTDFKVTAPGFVWKRLQRKKVANFGYFSPSMCRTRACRWTT